jgi:hypothetical protein
MSEDQGSAKGKDVDVMEGITDVSLNRANNDSFDSIFNKELDLDIGKLINSAHYAINLNRRGTHGFI